MSSVDDLSKYLASFDSSTPPRDLRDRVKRAVLEREAERLVSGLASLASGELRSLRLDDAWDTLEVVRQTATVQKTVCVVRVDWLREADDSLASKTLALLTTWVENAPRRMDGQLGMLFASELDVTKDPAVLDLALSARRAGWRVTVGCVSGASALVRADMHTTTNEVVTLVASLASGDPAGIQSVVRFENAPSSREAGQLAHGIVATDWREVGLPSSDGQIAGVAEPDCLDPAQSVADLFGENIMLRDFEPRSARLDGLESFRGDLGWDSIYVPRKNEPEYAQALLRIMGGADASGPEHIVYVGDTLLNDGGAIRGLQAVGPPGNVWGFLCGATKAAPAHDFTLGRIYFGAAWTSLVGFLHHAQADGLILDKGTWMLFDLDQTVYAAKGRDDEPLVRARWDAARDYLEQIIPAYRFDASRAESLYREFDRDDYHPITRDNLDYVVLLVLAVASGLADATEIRNYADSNRPSIGALAEELRRRASMRVGHEDIGAVLDAVKAVYYNSLAGDQTPCKDFRRLECLAMAARMRGECGDGAAARIFLNREVVDVIHFVQGTGAQLFAVSDRPLEAAVALSADDDLGAITDLMTIRMAARGVRLDETLSRLRS